MLPKTTQFLLTLKEDRGNSNKRKEAKESEEKNHSYRKTKSSFRMLFFTPNFQCQQNFNFQL